MVTGPSGSLLASMTGNQYILKPVGLLDKEGAHRILDAIAEHVRAGEERLVIDAHELQPVLPEGIYALRRGLAQLRRTAARSDWQVELVRLRELPATMFQVHGEAVEERRVLYTDSLPVPPRLRSASDRMREHPVLIACPHCEQQLNVYHPGHHICPHCNHTFHCDESGHTT